MEFGTWDGMTFAEVRERHPDDLDAWLGSLDARARRRRVVPRSCEKRVLAGLRPAARRSTPAGPCSWSAT